MKKMLVSVLMLSIASASFAAKQKITTYDELLKVLTAGGDAKALVNFDDCQLQQSSTDDPIPVSGAASRFNFSLYSTYKLNENGKTRSVISVPVNVYGQSFNFGFVLTYGRLRIYDDNSVQVHTALYDPKTFDLKANYDYLCHLSADKTSVSLLAN